MVRFALGRERGGPGVGGQGRGGEWVGWGEGSCLGQGKGERGDINF